jgi:hypothetical protein
MKKNYLVVRLKESVEKLKQWVNWWKRNDDDGFNHPFAIL